MENNQAKLVSALAKKLSKQKKSKISAISTLKSAGILDKDNNISKNYPTIRKTISPSISS